MWFVVTLSIDRFAVLLQRSIRQVISLRLAQSPCMLLAISHGVSRVKNSELPAPEGVWASGFCESCGAKAPSYTFSTGVTSGDPRPRFNQDVDGRVYVSV